MIQKQTLVVLVLLCASYLGFGQIYLHDFGTTTISAYPYTVAPSTFDGNLSNSSWSNSTGVWTSFVGNSGQAISLSNSSGTPIIVLTFDVAPGYQLDITSFNFWRVRSSTGAQNWSMTINGISVGNGTVPTSGSAIGNSVVSNAVSGLTGTITLQLFLSGATGSGTFRLDDFTLNGTVALIGGCSISDIAITDAGGCNDNGTPTNLTDDYYLADVVVTYANPPVSGDLILTGTGVVGGTTSVAVGSSPQTISGVRLAANENNVEIIATFSANTSCNYTETIDGSAVESCGGGDCSDLIISEYVEGSVENKYIEIYNPTSGNIDLSHYELALFSNGSGTATTTSVLSGILASGSTIVYRNTNATVYGSASTILSAVNYNGDDAIALLHSGNMIDVIGQIGLDPGTEWVSGSTTTLNRTLRRDHTVLIGDFDGTDAFNPSIEWTVFPIDDVSDLGFHFSDCIPSNELQLQVLLPAPTNILCGYTYDFGNVTLSSNSDVVLRIQNLGTNDLDITDLNFLSGTHYSLVSPPGIPFSIAGNSYQDLTIRFNPTNIGIFLDTLTITNSDASESICGIDLTGISVSNCGTTSVVLAAQDFESAGTDTWGYSAIHPGTDFPDKWGVVSSSTSIPSAESGSQFWGITDLERLGHEDQTHQLSFSYSGLLGYNNVQFSFYYYTIDVDTSDSFDYEILYDGVSQGTTSISANNDAWEQVLINIPATVDDFDIIFYADLDAENDQAGLDNFSLTSTTINTTTWDGTTWSNLEPDLSTVAIIGYSYDTTSNGNFSACSLIVNDDGFGGITLNITDGHFVEVENNLTVNGNITVQPKGAFIQNNDLGIVDGNVLSDKAKIVVNKKTARSNAWYEYTYWSSPVMGETIAEGLFESSSNRRFLFNAQNYLDHCAEINNNNICDDNGGAGLQDGIDDDGNDWQWVNGATVMEPGIGYASTHDSTIFGSTPGCPGSTCNIEYTFEGPFNNGEIKVPVYRNDFDINDTNSNFIGNPYPSAIDVDEFFNLNAYTLNASGALEGVIYLWSQNTLPSTTANGNQNLNFSDLDYAIINGMGQIEGGDGLKPERYIPSGQGFFVEYANLGAAISTNGTIQTGEVIFNNAMRVKGTLDNSQFFRTSNFKPSQSKGNSNKLWINLKSDIGISNQVLVGYVDGATNGNDDLYYDVPRDFKVKTATALYSLSQDGQFKYAIQGKDANSLNLGEVIPLGFYTAITGATLFKLSKAQSEGDFFNINTMYLKDNLLHVVHNLSESDYTFTSEVGEFNNRFEIVFQYETLSDTEALLNANRLTIIELNDGRIQFKTNTEVSIKSVKIIDLLGRMLYKLSGENSTEIYNLSNLSQSAYIAKVELNNGQIVTKRAVKRR